MLNTETITAAPAGAPGPSVARWIYQVASKRSDAVFEVVDIKDYDLPLLDEPMIPALHQYSKPHTMRWSAKIASFDAFIFVTPEYNHSTSGALKNAIDFLFREWNDKAAGFVGYGSAGGVRAVEQLRQIMGQLRVADMRTQVALSTFTDFDEQGEVNRRLSREAASHAGPVVAWGNALKVLRPAEAPGPMRRNGD
jgi:NAD(P)H-dependent FMN reductase